MNREYSDFGLFFWTTIVAFIMIIISPLFLLVYVGEKITLAIISRAIWETNNYAKYLKTYRR